MENNHSQSLLANKKSIFVSDMRRNIHVKRNDNGQVSVIYLYS